MAKHSRRSSITRSRRGFGQCRTAGPGGCGTRRLGRCRSQPDPDTAPSGLVKTYRTILARRFDVSAHAAPRGSWAGAYMMSRDERPVVGRVAARSQSLSRGRRQRHVIQDRTSHRARLGRVDQLRSLPIGRFDEFSDRFDPKTREDTTSQLMPLRSLDIAGFTARSITLVCAVRSRCSN